MKKFLMFSLLTTFVVGLMFSSADAARKKKKRKRDFAAIFKKLDKDSDGKLTLVEFTGKRTGKKAARAKKRFARLDKNNDNSLSLEEFKTRKKKKKK